MKLHIRKYSDHSPKPYYIVGEGIYFSCHCKTYTAAKLVAFNTRRDYYPQATVVDHIKESNMAETVTIDGIEYVPRKTEGEELRISIVDNSGLTFVGFVDIHQPPGTIVTIRRARCVIRWGAKNHLAELVNGPLENTKLGATADVEVLIDNLVASYRCAGEWYD